MRILFLEPFYGGSHRDFADGLVEHSRHEMELVTLPARFWKWRMRGAAPYFAEMVEQPERYDGVMASGLLSVADLKALWGARCPPVLTYFHENQFDYPLSPGESMDYQFGFLNVTTCLAADRVLFNSHFQRGGFLRSATRFLERMPDGRIDWAVGRIRDKSAVLYPGCRFDAGPPSLLPLDPQGNQHRAPLIIWNHRWEFDKAPKTFFRALNGLAGRGVDFTLALLGERYRNVPEPFQKARQRLASHIVVDDFLPSKEAYFDWLRRGRVVVSTAIQENFGISVVEAVRHGCLPLLPNRLVYPELLPESFHEVCLYHSVEELEDKLTWVLLEPEAFSGARAALAEVMGRFAWENSIVHYDEELQSLCERS